MQRLEFQLNEYAKLEGAIRSGFTRIEENVGAAVTRILAPFLESRSLSMWRTGYPRTSPGCAREARPD